MRKVKDLYNETQKNSVRAIDKVTEDRMKKIYTLANREYQTCARNEDFQNLDQSSFYRDRFREALQVFNQSKENHYKKQQFQDEMIKIFRDNYQRSGNNQFQQRQYRIQPRQTKIEIRQVENSFSNNNTGKEIIASFYDNKKAEIEKSKVGFKSVIQNIARPQRKYNIKASSSRNINNDQIRRLEREISDLKQKLAYKQSSKDFNQGLLEVQKNQHHQRVQYLEQKIEDLKDENLKLKSECSVREVITVVKTEEVDEDYEPYKIKIKHNDITKINTKNQTKNNAGHNYAVEGIENKSQFNGQSNYKTHIARKYSEQFDQSDLSLSRDRTNLQNYYDPINESQSIYIKSKLSFFKQNMVIHKESQFDIAVKKKYISEEKVKIFIYINNKTNIDKQVELKYDFDTSYYKMDIVKKIYAVEKRKQSRQEIEITLDNRQDIDSLIEAHIIIGSKDLKFLIPAMFIQFENRPLNYGSSEALEKYEVQPSEYFKYLGFAEELIPLKKQYGKPYEVGQLYGRSRHHEGEIILKWNKRNALSVETIKPWKLYLSFLFSKQI